MRSPAKEGNRPTPDTLPASPWPARAGGSLSLPRLSQTAPVSRPIAIAAEPPGHSACPLNQRLRDPTQQATSTRSHTHWIPSSPAHPRAMSSRSPHSSTLERQPGRPRVRRTGLGLLVDILSVHQLDSAKARYAMIHRPPILSDSTRPIAGGFPPDKQVSGCASSYEMAYHLQEGLGSPLAC